MIATVSVGAEFRDPIRDAEAWAASMVSRSIRRDLNGRRVTRQEREDAVQDVLALLAELETSFDPSKSPSFAAYATRIVSRRLIDFGARKWLGRNGQRIAERDARAEASELSGHPASVSGDAELRVLMDALPPRQRAIARLIVLGHLSAEDIARRLRLSRATVDRELTAMREFAAALLDT